MIIRPAVSNGQARPTRVEGILQVVGAGRHLDAGGSQVGHGGEPSRHRGVATTLEEEVGVGERDHTDSGRCDRARRSARRSRLRLHTEADAVAGRRPDGRNPRGHQSSQIHESARRRVERLVGVQVDADTVIDRRLQKELGRSERVAALEMRSTRPRGRHRPRAASTQQRSLVGAAEAHDRPATQRDDLDIDDIGDASLHLDERLDASQSVLERGVGMAAYRPIPVRCHQTGCAFGPFDGFVDADQVSVRSHGGDGPHQVTGRVHDPLCEERLVEVGMRFDGCGHEQVPVEFGRPRRPVCASSRPTAVITPSTMRTSCCRCVTPS